MYSLLKSHGAQNAPDMFSRIFLNYLTELDILSLAAIHRLLNTSAPQMSLYLMFLCSVYHFQSSECVFRVFSTVSLWRVIHPTMEMGTALGSLAGPGPEAWG